MAIFTLNFKSRQLNTPTEVKVLLPDVPTGSNPKDHYIKKFKVLWLLHGGNSDPNDWLLKTNIARYVRYEDIMVVFPTAINSFYSNYTYPGFNYWNYLNDELMPMIQGWFPASTDPQDNYLGGFSMGGLGTMMLGFTRPELFAGLIIMSIAPIGGNNEWLYPLRDFSSMEFRKWVSSNRETISDLHTNIIARYPTVGDYLDSCENCWDRFAEVVNAGKLPKTFAGIGKQDYLYPEFLKFQEYSKQLGANIHFESLDDFAHEFEYWDIGIKHALEFFELVRNVR